MSRSDREVATSVAKGLRSQAQQLGWARDPVGWARDVLGVHLWSKQREISNSLVDNKKTVVASCHGTGKALCVETLIPTPEGFTEMGHLAPGDIVLGSSGEGVKIRATTGVHLADRWRVTLSGEGTFQQIVASSDHLWPVMTDQAAVHARVQCRRRNLPLHTGRWHHRAEVRDTRQIADMVRSGRRLIVPAQTPQSRVQPAGSSRILEDLMSERGSVDPIGRPCLIWHTRSTALPDDLVGVREELHRQGLRTLLRRDRQGGSVLLTLTVTTGGVTAALPKADDRAMAETAAAPSEHEGWRIERVEPIGPGAVQCIEVDSPDHLYLCGEARIPTHNSMIASVLSCWWISTHPLGEAIVVSTAPSYPQVNKILWEEIRKHHATAKRRGHPLVGYVTQGDEWKTTDGQILGFGRKPPSGDQGAHAFQGIHRRYVLVIIDEACHDDQTEVMTEDGWKFFADLTGSERLLTMSPETHEATYRQPTKLVKKPYSGPMYLYEAKGANFCVTPDHDMYFHGRTGRMTDTAWRKAPMRELVGKTNKYMKKTINWVASDQEKFELPEHRCRKFFPARFVAMDDWMRFLGWYLSEGSLIRSRGVACGIVISQNDEGVLREIADLAERLGFDPKMRLRGVSIHNAQLARHFEQFGSNCLEKRPPEYARMASPRQISLLLDTYLRGDGYEKPGQGIIYTSSPRMADDLQEMILKTGRPSVVHKRELAGQESDFGTHVATSSVDGYVVTRPHQDSKIKFYPQNLTEIDYNGTVYCAAVPPEALLLTRRNGYSMWSGNCGIPPELWTGSEAITTNAGCRILAIGNPDDRNTDFGDIYLSPKQAQDWNRIRVPASSTPNFTGEEVPPILNEVLVSKEWCEQRERAWGKDDPRYMSKIDAKFPEQSQSSLFPPALITSAFEDVPLQPVGQVVRLGMDVARFGADDNVLVSYIGSTARVESVWGGTDTVSSGHQVLHLAEEIMKRQKASWVEIRVDAIGLGAGVVDTLNARLALLERPWFSVYEMYGNAAPPVDVGGSVQGYGNARAFWYDQLRQSLRNQRVRLEASDTLAEDLRIIFYHFKTGRLFIMSKDEMRKIHKRSPDYADALVYATAPVAEGLESGQTLSKSAEEVVYGLDDLDDPELSIAPF